MSQDTRGGVVALPEQPDAVAKVGQFLSRLQPEIARSLPKGLDADRITRIALTLVRQSDNAARAEGKPERSLAACSTDSFAGALLTASALGLEPGVNGEAWLVPYKQECTFIAGYQGLAKLFWQHPRAEYLDAHAVYEADEFDYEYGLNQFLHHKPGKGDRGKVVYYWAAARMANTAARFVVLSPEEVKALRGGKVGPSGKIIDPQRWMERKTALRQLLKLVPKSVTLTSAVAVDEQRGSVLANRGVPAAIMAQEPIGELPPAGGGLPAEGRVTSAEITRRAPVSQPASSDEPAAKPVTPAQLKDIHTLLTNMKVTDQTERRVTLELMVRRPIESSKELTQAEAREVFMTLSRIAQQDDAPTALSVYLGSLDMVDDA